MKIAICGKMCSGKTTLAQTIMRMDDRYKVFSIGGKVKEVARDLFGSIEKDRPLLIAIGAKMREIDPEVWIKYVIKQTKNESHCIIDDLRYQNEYDLLKEQGFVFIQLHVTHAVQEQRIMKLYPKTFQDHLDNRDHLSEQNAFVWSLGKDPVFHIDNGEDATKVNQKIHSFLQKNENNR
jgi:cytidylate kinase